MISVSAATLETFFRPRGRPLFDHHASKVGEGDVADCWLYVAADDAFNAVERRRPQIGAYSHPLVHPVVDSNARPESDQRRLRG